MSDLRIKYIRLSDISGYSLFLLEHFRHLASSDASPLHARLLLKTEWFCSDQALLPPPLIIKIIIH